MKVLKWGGRLAVLAVAFYLAESYASSTVRDRISSMRETLVTPTGRYVQVAKSGESMGPRLGGKARILSTEPVAFGYRVTYAAPGRPEALVCTYRLPGVSCEGGWTVFWTQR